MNKKIIQAKQLEKKKKTTATKEELKARMSPIITLLII